jgi:hypothetical protein
MGARIMVELESVDLKRVYGTSTGDELCAALAREALKHSLEVLRANPAPDTFAGRKTQEPFPLQINPVGGSILLDGRRLMR